jgi:hypothetical protein
MGRSRKKQCKQPSVINTNLDNRFSPSHNNADGDSDSSVQSTESLADVPAIPQKHQKVAVTQAPAPDTPTASLITYVTSIFSTADMKKAVSKQSAKNLSFQL